MAESPQIDRSVIRPIAICVFRRDGQVLVGEGYDSARGERFHRPVGGSLRFGETSLEAVMRELREELGVDLHAPRLPGVLESIFTCEVQPSHEIVFVYEAEFADRRLYERGMLRGCEWCGNAFAAVWRDLRADSDELPPLFPHGLAELLEPRAALKARDGPARGLSLADLHTHERGAGPARRLDHLAVPRSLRNKRQKCHFARALDGVGELCLMLAAGAGLSRLANLPLIVKVALQQRHILVVENVLFRRDAEATDLLLSAPSSTTAPAISLSCHDVILLISFPSNAARV